MRLPLLSVALVVASALPGHAFDADTQAVMDRLKAGKLVQASDVAVLMRGAERWCYNEQDGNCAWSDIYLSVEGTEIRYEISNPWNEMIDISSVDHAVFEENRYVCEVGFDWIPSVRAYDRSNGTAIEGRALDALRQEIRGYATPEDNDTCYDYLYRGADADGQVVMLLQRQYVDGVTDASDDAPVTLYFDKDAAENLGWYW
jgi:hypothetical protein